MKPVQPRAAAESDVGDAFDYYWTQGGQPLAERFLDAYEAALAHIAQHPGTGSPRHARTTRIEHLRFWTLTHFPFAVFYVEHTDRIDVLRVLHQASDLPHQLP
ncbi:type II toxin-antitoxin system RelE/ParE family toxin [Ottowia sp.]|uniref:type II toxin-antitoxin system RelE/ParE family toxin n=1 Tax=Ottowia sp. TaxID=1898956 RepID=UPI0039E27227